MLSRVELRKIKKSLPVGSLTNIQKKAGGSYLTVLKFFKGESQNSSVREAVIAEYREYLGKMEDLKTLL